MNPTSAFLNFRQLIFRQRENIDTIDQHLAAGRKVERAQDIQQRRLAAPGRTNNSHKFCGANLQIDSEQNRDI